MPGKKGRKKEDPRLISKGSSIKIGNISDISGQVNIAGRDITTHQTTSGLSAAEIKQLFDQIYSAIEARPETPIADKEDLKAEVEEVQSAVIEAAEKNEEVRESFLSRRFRNIARVAPDVLDVVVATLTSPLAGVGIAVKKIADKAKEEAGAN
jgi:hypothetical protein